MITKGLDLGGAERVVVDLAVHLAAHGVHVEVASINSRRHALQPVLHAAGITVHELPGSDYVGLRGVLALRRVIGGGGFDVVHGHGPAATALASLLARRRSVGTIHSMWHSLRRPSRWAAVVCRPARVIAVSAAARDALPTRLRERAVVIGHGVDLAAVDTAMVGNPRADRAHVELLTVASHRAAKNYGNLLRAVAEARTAGADVNLRAIGEGPRLAAHQQLAAELHITDHVSFEAPRADVLGQIVATDVFVLASDTEGQPIVLVEALAAGRPVIATAVGRAPELVTPQVGILVPPADSHALAQAIEALAADPARRASMSAAALADRQHYSLDHGVLAHVAVYHEVAA